MPEDQQATVFPQIIIEKLFKLKLSFNPPHEKRKKSSYRTE